MRKLGFIWVGKLKESHAKDGCAHYWKKLSRFFKVEETMVRDAPGKLPSVDKKTKEGEAILAKVKPGDMVVILDEHGDRLTSRQLAKEIERWTDVPNGRPVFVIGGPFGLSEEVKAAARRSIRLSDMTLPHELARLVLLEQLYRAGTILKNLPYHHD